MAGSKPGERRGGRKKGTPNKRTRARQELMAKLLDTCGGDPNLAADALLGVEVLRYWAREFDRIARIEWERDKAKGKIFADAAISVAAKLAPYQSPQLRAVVVTPPPRTGPRRFSLTIFNRPLLEHIEEETDDAAIIQ